MKPQSTHKNVVLQPGCELGKYLLSKRLARGGMGEVWLATSRGSSGFRKSMVLKTILPEHAASPAFVKLFAEEACLTAQLRHPNLIDVYDFAFAQGVHYIVMEYLEGWTLAQIRYLAAKRRRSIPEWFILRVAEQCCRGLHHAHTRSGIIHCDLSPGNIMVSQEGNTKVVDFGVARSLHSKGGSLHNGKLAYLAPERLTNKGVDARSDVYSLGVIMYLLFTDRLPFQGEDREVARAIVQGSLPPPGRFCSMDPGSEEILLRALATNPKDRYQSVGEMGEAIKRLGARYPYLNPIIDTADYMSALAADNNARAPVDKANPQPRWRVLSELESRISESPLEISSAQIEFIDVDSTPLGLHEVAVDQSAQDEPAAPSQGTPRARRAKSETSIQRLFHRNELGSQHDPDSTPSPSISRVSVLFQPSETSSPSTLRVSPFGGALHRQGHNKQWPWAVALRKPRE